MWLGSGWFRLALLGLIAAGVAKEYLPVEEDVKVALNVILFVVLAAVQVMLILCLVQSFCVTFHVTGS